LLIYASSNYLKVCRILDEINVFLEGYNAMLKNIGKLEDDLILFQIQVEHIREFLKVGRIDLSLKTLQAAVKLKDKIIKIFTQAPIAIKVLIEEYYFLGTFLYTKDYYKESIKIYQEGLDFIKECNEIDDFREKYRF